VASRHHQGCSPRLCQLRTDGLGPVDYQVPWTEFCNAFCAQCIPIGVMRKKRQEFIDLKQGGRSVHDYSKQFNHLAQYAPDQVDTVEKKKDRFMIGLSTPEKHFQSLSAMS
jgi:hypothetical protein